MPKKQGWLLGPVIMGTLVLFTCSSSFGKEAHASTEKWKIVEFTGDYYYAEDRELRKDGELAKLIIHIERKEEQSFVTWYFNYKSSENRTVLRQCDPSGCQLHVYPVGPLADTLIGPTTWNSSTANSAKQREEAMKIHEVIARFWASK